MPAQPLDRVAGKDQAQTDPGRNGRTVALLRAQSEHRGQLLADLFPAGELRNHVRSEHLVALGVEACFDYDTPAAVFVPTQSGDSARRIALLRLPVWTVAAAAGEVALRRLQFSCGVLGLRVPEPPASWSAFARDWVRAAGFRGSRVILTSGPSAARPDAHNRLEIIDL